MLDMVKLLEISETGMHNISPAQSILLLSEHIRPKYGSAECQEKAKCHRQNFAKTKDTETHLTELYQRLLKLDYQCALSDNVRNIYFPLNENLCKRINIAFFTLNYILEMKPPSSHVVYFQLNQMLANDLIVSLNELMGLFYNDQMSNAQLVRFRIYIKNYFNILKNIIDSDTFFWHQENVSAVLAHSPNQFKYSFLNFQLKTAQIIYRHMKFCLSISATESAPTNIHLINTICNEMITNGKIYLLPNQNLNEFTTQFQSLKEQANQTINEVSCVSIETEFKTFLLSELDKLRRGLVNVFNELQMKPFDYESCRQSDSIGQLGSLVLPIMKINDTCNLESKIQPIFATLAKIGTSDSFRTTLQELEVIVSLMNTFKSLIPQPIVSPLDKLIDGYCQKISKLSESLQNHLFVNGTMRLYQAIWSANENELNDIKQRFSQLLSNNQLQNNAFQLFKQSRFFCIDNYGLIHTDKISKNEKNQCFNSIQRRANLSYFIWQHLRQDSPAKQDFLNMAMMDTSCLLKHLATLIHPASPSEKIQTFFKWKEVRNSILMNYLKILKSKINLLLTEQKQEPSLIITKFKLFNSFIDSEFTIVKVLMIQNQKTDAIMHLKKLETYSHQLEAWLNQTCITDRNLYAEILSYSKKHKEKIESLHSQLSDNHHKKSKMPPPTYQAKY